ncbi:MAG: SCP2 sterol-binding domain-containing protein [Promethearchaeota archaeon]
MDTEELQVKVLMFAMVKAIEEIAKVDEDMQEELEDLEGRIQWKVANIRAYQIFGEGLEYSFGFDKEIEDPNVTLTISELATAKRFFTGELDGTSAYMSGDLAIEGDLQFVMAYSSVADLLLDYLEPLIGR